MKCPVCTSTEQRVLSTRTSDSKVSRLRCCDVCGHRWNTAEIGAQDLQRLQTAFAAMRTFLNACKEIEDAEHPQA